MKAGLLWPFTVPGKLYLLTIEALGSLKSLVFCRYMYYMYCRYHVAFARCRTHLMEQHLQASNSVHQRPCTSQLMQNVRFAFDTQCIVERGAIDCTLPMCLLRMTLGLRLGRYHANWNSESVKHKIVITAKWALSWDWKKMKKSLSSAVDRFLQNLKNLKQLKSSASINCKSFQVSGWSDCANQCRQGSSALLPSCWSLSKSDSRSQQQTNPS